MTEALTLVATLHAAHGNEEELGRRLGRLVEPTISEAGCISYKLHRSADEGAVWMLFEEWRSRADLDLHFETPYLQEFLRDAPALLADTMDLRFYRGVECRQPGLAGSAG